MKKATLLLTAIAFLFVDTCAHSTVAPTPQKTALPDVHLKGVQEGSMNLKGNTLSAGPGNNVGNFSRFNIPLGTRLNVTQPRSAFSVARVEKGNPSKIAGTLSVKNGTFMLANPSGAYFTKDATIDASKIIAAAADYKRDAKGRYFLETSDTGEVFFGGTANIQNNGLFSIVGRTATHDGTVTGENVRVEAIAGDDLYMTFEGNKLIGFRAENSKHSGSIKTTKDSNIQTKGPVYMRAYTAEQIVQKSVNADQNHEATQSYVDKAGNIVLGGTIETEGHDIDAHAATVHQESTSLVDASGHGKVGHIRIGGQRDFSDPKAKPTFTAKKVSSEEGAQIKAQRYGDGPAGSIFVGAEGVLDLRGSIDGQVWGKGPGTIVERSFGQLVNAGTINLTHHGTGTPGVSWYDPPTIDIDANFASMVMADLKGWDVKVEATNAINVRSPITWDSSHTLMFRTTGTGHTDRTNFYAKIIMQGTANTLVWQESPTASPHFFSGGGIESSVPNRNYFIVSMPSNGSTAGSFAGLHYTESFILKRGGSVEQGGHITSSETIATPRYSTAANASSYYTLAGFKSTLSGPSGPNSNPDNGITSGTLDQCSVTIGDGTTTKSLLRDMAGVNLVSHVDLIFDGDINDTTETDRGFLAWNVSTNGKLYGHHINMSAGNIAAHKRVGALLGASYSGYISLNNLNILTLGNIHGDNEVGGLIGKISSSNVLLQNIAIDDTAITGGTQRIAGLFGDSSNSAIDVNHLTAKGFTINAPNTESGGLIGYNDTNTVTFNRIAIESLTAPNLPLMMGYRNGGSFTMDGRFAIVDTDVASFDTTGLTWGANAHGILSGKVATLPTGLVTGIPSNLFLRLHNDTHQFFQWGSEYFTSDGNIGSFTGIKPSIILNGSNRILMKLIPSESGSNEVPYDIVQFGSDDGSGVWEFETYTHDNPSDGTANFSLDDTQVTEYTTDRLQSDIAPSTVDAEGVITDHGEGFSYTHGVGWQGTVEGGATLTPKTEGFQYNSGDSTWKASIEGGETPTPAAEGFDYDGDAKEWVANIENNTLTTATPGAEGYVYSGSSWLATVDGGSVTTNQPRALGFTYKGGNWVAPIEGGDSTTPTASGFTYDGSTWVANIENNTLTTATPGAEGYVYSGSSWLATVDGGAVTTNQPRALGFEYNGSVWQAPIEGGASANPTASGFSYNGSAWVAAIENNTLTTTTPAAEGYTYNGSSWLATVDGGAVTTNQPRALGFEYNGSVWQASIEGGASANPTAAGFNYNGSAWVAAIENNTLTTSTPAAEGYAYNGSEWTANVDGASVTTNQPRALGFTYKSGNWVAPIEGGDSSTPTASGFTYDGSTWVANIENNNLTTTTPAAEGYAYNGVEWTATVDGGSVTTNQPRALGFQYNGTLWQAPIEEGSSTTATPTSEGYIYQDGSWKGLTEGTLNNAPKQSGFIYNGTVWEAPIENNTRSTTTPDADGYVYNGSEWTATVDGSMITNQPHALGFQYNGSTWQASIEGGSSSTTTPTNEGYIYQDGSWKGLTEGTLNSAPKQSGFTYNGTQWVANLPGGETSNPNNIGYTYNGQEWTTTIESPSQPGQINFKVNNPADYGFSYDTNRRAWVARIKTPHVPGGHYITATPREHGFSFNTSTGQWHKVSLSLVMDSIDDADRTQEKDDLPDAFNKGAASVSMGGIY